MMKFTYKGANPDCFVGISVDNTLAGNYWLLGDTFLRAYLMLYDKGNNQIGFIGLIDSNLSETSTGIISNTVKIIIICVSVSVAAIAIILIIIIVKCCCKRESSPQ